MRYIFFLLMFFNITAFAKVTNSLDAGITYATGNNYLLGVHLEEKFSIYNNRHRFDTSSFFIYNHKKYSDNVIKIEGNIKYGKLWGMHKLFMGVGYLRYTNKYDHRLKVDLGYGHQLFGEVLGVELGSTYILEDFNITKSSFHYRGSIQLNVDPVPNISIFFRGQGLLNVRDLNDYRFDFITGFKLYFAKPFSYKISYKIEYYNLAPIFKTDRILLSSVSWNF